MFGPSCYDTRLRQTLARDLQYISKKGYGSTLPTQALEILSDLKIYLNKNYTFAHALHYGYVAMTYNSASWLEYNGNNPKKQSHIEIYDVKRYLAEFKIIWCRPYTVLTPGLLRFFGIFFIFPDCYTLSENNFFP